MPEEQEDGLSEAENTDEQEAQETSETSVSAEEFAALKAKADESKGFAARVAAENKRLKKELKSRTEPTELNSDDIKEPTTSLSEERFERLELKTDGYSDAEIEQIMELGGKTALQNPILKEGLAVQRKKAKSQEATPAGTAKSPGYEGTTNKDIKTI